MKSGKCSIFWIRQTWTAMSIITRTAVWSRADRSPFADGWKRKTAALTAQRYSFTNRCCFWSVALTVTWLYQLRGRLCKPCAVSSPIWNTAFIKPMAWRSRTNARSMGNVPTVWFPGRTNPACAWCTTGSTCRVLKMSRIIHNIRDKSYLWIISSCHLSGQSYHALVRKTKVSNTILSKFMNL